MQKTGSISGVITGGSADPFPGVIVTIFGGASGYEAQTVTNAAGEYRFANLPPETYNLTAVMTGFKTERIYNVVVQEGKDTKENFALQFEPID